MRSKDKIHNILTRAGCEPLLLADKDVWSWQQRWRAVYARELHVATGKWTFNGFEWHVFSFGHHTSRAGDAAWAEYRGLEPCCFLVLSAEDRWSGGFSCSGKPPDRLKAGIDILVTPTSLEWTMVFTHEEPIHGPYSCGQLKERPRGSPFGSNRPISDVGFALARACARTIG